MPQPPSDTREIIQVVGACSPPVREHVLSLSSLLGSWGYAVRVIGEVDDDFAKDLGKSKVPAMAASLPAGESLAGSFYAARSLARLLQARSPLLVHAHGLRAGLYATLARRMGLRSPVVCTPNLLPHLLAPPSDRRWRRRAYRYVLDRSNAVIATSEVQRRELDRIAPGVDARVVPYGIDARRHHDPMEIGRRRQLLGITPTAAVVGCVADTMPDDCLRLFLDAAAELCGELANLEFAIICDGDHRDRYSQMAHERGLLGATVFLQPRGGVTSLLTPLNVLVVPQPGWPAGQLALQALLRGLGVVAIGGGETEEMLSGSAGVTIAPEAETVSLAGAIRLRLEGEAERMRSTAGGSAPVEAVQFLVSREAWDIGRSWERPQSLSDGATDPVAAEAASAFGITNMARATVAVYHGLLDEHA